MKIIDLENHFNTPLNVEHMLSRTEYPKIDKDKGLGFYDDTWVNVAPHVNGYLRDIGEGRVKLMDECGIDFAQLSLTAPGAECYDAESSKKIAEDSNNVMAALIKEYPDRLGAYITLAPKDADWSINEIDRCLEMGLWGWHTHSNFRDSYLDEKQYWPILKKCEELDMPIYLHPSIPRASEIRTFGVSLATPSFGYTVDTWWCFMRLIHRGVFDEFPKLKMILGHFGEGLPFFFNRINAAFRQGYGQPPAEMGGYKNEPSYYVRNNVWVTSSGNYLPDALYCTKNVLGLDKITLGTDHPFEPIALGVDFLRDDPILTEKEKETIFYDNAKALGFAKNL